MSHRSSSKTSRHYLSTPRTARVVMCGESSARTLWIVLHGYAQTADEFMVSFQDVAGSDRLVVAPEGLSRFYKRGMRGEVGASWMTSRDRTSEIENHVIYLDRVLQSAYSKAPKLENVNVLGFSQGAATAARWTTQGDVEVNRLVLWGGGIPEDISFSKLPASAARVTFVFGRSDPYISEEDVNTLQARARDSELICDFVRYDGHHHVDEDTLKVLVQDDSQDIE